MDATCGNSDSAGAGGGSGSSSSRWYGVQFTTSNYLQAPLFALLEYCGILRNPNPRSINPQSEPPSSSSMSTAPAVAAASSDGEVAIRIIGSGDHDSLRVLETDPLLMNSAEESEGLVREGGEDREVTSSSSSSSPPNSVASPASGSGSNAEGEGQNEHSNGGRDSSYQRFDIQQVARWIEQVLPFSLLLLVVFIRQHLQGFFVTIWIAAVMFKSNDILRKQTALKGERKISVLAAITSGFMVHVFGVYWWYKKDDLLYPLVLFPPKEIPPFWHALFIIMVNGKTLKLAELCDMNLKLLVGENFLLFNRELHTVILQRSRSHLPY